MISISSRSRYFILPVLFLTLLIVNGCTWFSSQRGAQKSPSGYRPEMFFAENTVVLASLDYRDQTNRETLKPLIALLKDKDGKSVFDTMRDSFFTTLYEQGYNYEQHIKPILGDGTRFVFGLGDAETLSNYFGSRGTMSLPLMVGFQIASTQKFDEFVQMLEKKGEVKLERYGEYSLFQGIHPQSSSNATSIVSDDGCLTRVEDIGLLTNNCGLMKEVIDRGVKDKQNLDRSVKFQTVVKELATDAFGFLYVDVASLIDIFKKNVGTGGNIEKVFASIPEVEAEGLTISLVEKGIAVAGYQYADKTKFGAKSFKDVYSQSKLINKMVGDEMMLYFEGAALKNVLQTYIETFDQQLADRPAGTPIRSVKDALRVVGLDLEKDVLSWMDRGFALGISMNAGNIIPNLTLMVDGSTKKEAVSRFAETVDAQLQGVLTLIRVQGGDEAANSIKRDKQGTLYHISANPVGLSKSFESLKDPGGSSQMLDLTYGATSDNLFVISTATDFVKKYGNESFANDPSFKRMLDRLSDADTVVNYVNVENIMKYLTVIEPLYQKGLSDPQSKAGYEKLKAFMKAFKAGIMAVEAEKTDARMEGFIELSM